MSASSISFRQALPLVLPFFVILLLIGCSKKADAQQIPSRQSSWRRLLRQYLRQTNRLHRRAT